MGASASSARLDKALGEIETLRRAALDGIAQALPPGSSPNEPAPRERRVFSSFSLSPPLLYEWQEYPEQTYAALVQELANGKCNSSVLSAHVEAVKAAQGPAVTEVRSAKAALKLVTSSVQDMKENASRAVDIQYQSRVEYVSNHNNHHRRRRCHVLRQPPTSRVLLGHVAVASCK